MEKDTFQALGLAENFIRGLAAQGITAPTAVQAAAFAPIRAGKDLLCAAQTGSGKTLAYLLPLLMGMDWEARAAQAIVLTPTHELAVQVEKQAVLLAENAGLPLRTALLIGGANKERQLLRVKEKPQLIVGNPGRVLEIIQMRKLKVATVRTIVLDEADRLLGDLNLEGVKAVVKTTLKDRQLVALSATMDEKTRRTAKELMKENPQEIGIAPAKLPESITHSYLVTPFREKVQTLRKLLAAETPEKAVIFLNNPENILVTVDKLCYHGLKAVGLYGADKKESRRRALEAFRDGRANLLVATDLAARGLDIPGLTHVIQMDAPEDMAQYLHRVGRCGRQGMPGKAILIMTPGQTRWVRAYEKAFGIKLTEQELAYGKLTNKKNAKENRK